MAITRISQSSVKEGLEKYNSFVAGIPGIFGNFESISTITVNTASASAIEFTSIPQTYQHLQIRGIGRSDWTNASADQLRPRLNNDSGSNYAIHFLLGTGASALAEGYTGQVNLNCYNSMAGPNAPSNVFGAVVIDILDYTNTSKNKVMRCFGGIERNGSGEVSVSSGLWISTAAVTSIQLTKIGSNFMQNTTYALYGIRA